jgi:hypothetical protein
MEAARQKEMKVSMTEDATTSRTRSEIGARVVLGVAMNWITADRALFQSSFAPVRRNFATDCVGQNAGAQR